MTNDTTLANQVQEHFSSVTQDIASIKLERSTRTMESTRTMQNGETNARKSKEKENRYLIEQKLAQRCYFSGYKGL